jgi:hypothetical protein
MASELRVNTLKDAAGANSVAMEYVAGGSAKAWFSWNGTGTAALYDSFNTSSLNDEGTGLYTFTVTNGFSDANFTSVGMGSSGNSDAAATSMWRVDDNSVASTTIRIGVTFCTAAAQAKVDRARNNTALHGDLA